MNHRYEISDADWDRIQDFLPGQPGQHGGVAQDNRRFLNAVLWIARTGAAWEDLPERLGGQQPVAAIRPVGQDGPLGDHSGGPPRPGPRCLDPRLDCGPRPLLRGGCEKKWDGTGGQNDQALGRSRGGFGTKIHGSFDGLGHPVELLLTAAQESDIAQAETLLAYHEPEVVITDKGYDKKALVEQIESRGAQAVIPTRKNRIEPRPIDPHWYRERNLRERFWSQVKQYRRVATRYEKKAANFRAFANVAAVMVMLK